MASGAQAAPRTAVRRPLGGESPLFVSTLVAPALAAVPVLWVALVARTSERAIVTAETVAIVGVLVALASANGARSHAYARGESVAATQRDQEFCFVLALVGAALGGLTAMLASPRMHAVVALVLTAAALFVVTALAVRRRRLLVAAVTILNLAWVADLALVLGLAAGAW
jgi:NADH:ubiquinone oxidoreductase subunit 2 (subunit N)